MSSSCCWFVWKSKKVDNKKKDKWVSHIYCISLFQIYLQNDCGNDGRGWRVEVERIGYKNGGPNNVWDKEGGEDDKKQKF